MKQAGLYTISQFAKMSGISRPNLIYYDKEKILSPSSRDPKNGYRYYNFQQLNQAFTIHQLQKLGLSLKEIKDSFQEKDIDSLHKLLGHQKKLIQKRIEEDRLSLYQVSLFESNMNEIAKVEIPGYQITRQEKQTILLENDSKSYPTMYDFILDLKEKGHYQAHIGRLFTHEQLKSGDFSRPNKLYLYHPAGNTTIASGNYLNYYNYSDGSNLGKIYNEFKAIIKKENVVVDGSMYEDYPLTGLQYFNKDRQLIRLRVKIHNRKNSTQPK